MMIQSIGANDGVILNKNISASQKSVSKPIEQNKANTLSPSESLKSYFLASQLMGFKGFPCTTGEFAVKKLDDVPCCCCGARMIRGPQMPAVIQSFTSKSGKELADKIDKDKDYFRSNQKAVASIMADEARKDNSLDVVGAFEKAKNNYPAKVQNYCVNVLNELAESANSAYQNENNPMSQLAAKEIENVKKGNIQRMPFTEKLEALKGQLPQEKYEAVLDKAMNLPENMKSVDQIFNKNFKQGYSNQTVMDRLLKGALQTTEHVHPHSLGGPDATSNYLGECALCNNPRGSMSYAQWLKVHPEYPIKVQGHIEYITQKIVDGEIPSSYDSYPVDIKKTLSNESKGAMKLKVLNPETIKNLREQKSAGKNADVSKVTKEIHKNNSEEETQAKNKKK